MMRTKACIFLLLVLTVSCDDKRQNFDKAIIPPVPVNFSEVNSAYDDYNSDLSISWNYKSFSLLFSSSRDHAGDNFDFIRYNCEVYGDLITGGFDISAIRGICSLVDPINSPGNELGPYFAFEFEQEGYENSDSGERRFFYTTDLYGTNDIYYCLYENNENDILAAGEPAELEGINSEYDEGYLTIHPGEIANRETIYFTSNRDNTFDIYRAVSEENKLIDKSPGLTIEKVEQLSSNADDKFPYIRGNIMVFASDRTGGFGGFDLWYSYYEGQEWSEPINFGETINTEYDEYRPIVIPTDKEGFFNDMMIFSSDRPGGKGGFDLYYAGIIRRY